MKQYHSKHIAALSTRGFYTILTVCGMIIAVSAWVLWSNHSAADKMQPVAEPPIITPVQQMPDLVEDTPVVSEDSPAEDAAQMPEEPAEPVDAPPAPETAPPTPSVTVAAPVYVRPTSGAIITPFSGDELLFQPTFGDWRTHSGTDFGAAAGENVLALTDGTVQEVFEDSLYGSCVSISHDADLITTYRGLTDVRVVAGQAVTAGEALGACAESIAAEASLGTHVHVDAARAGTPIDVLSLLGESEVE